MISFVLSRLLGFERAAKKNNLEQQFSEGLLITQPSNSVREHSDHIPSDLLVEIFLRVPTKSIGRFRCVSKSWRSITRLPDFTELFLTKSSLTRPRILFVIKDDDKGILVFSSPQPQINHLDGEDYSLVATRYDYLPEYVVSGTLGQICPPIRGLVFLHGREKKRLKLICNPVTGESITLPREYATVVKNSFFGYDPINKQFKVLCRTCNSRYGRPITHRILTLGTGEGVWRSTMECKPHDFLESTATGICINGVLYYRARFEEGGHMMVCFDFSSEKFSSIKMHEEMLDGNYGMKLMNYKGKLCAHYFDKLSLDRLVLWVLEEDDGERKWSKSVCLLPPFRGGRIGNSCYVVGTTGAGEIVFQPINPRYLVFYNMERNAFTRVDIHGFPKFKKQFSPYCYIFLDYVESMTPLV